MKRVLGLLLRPVLTAIICAAGMYFIYKMLPADLASNLSDMWWAISLMVCVIVSGIVEGIAALFRSDKGN